MLNRKLWVDVVGFIFGVGLNVSILVITIYMVYSYTIKAYDAGKKYGLETSGEKVSREVEIEIKEDATMEEVAKELVNKGVIKNDLMFRLENLIKGNDEPYAAGTFTLNTAMDVNQINYALRSTPVSQTDLTIVIREGFSVGDIAEYLESKEIVTAEEFLEACEKPYDYPFLSQVPERENRLEGYLFPDTYFIRENSTPEEIIHKLLTRFEDIYTEKYADRAEEMGLSMDEVITIASIIEKEIRVDEERSLAAEVIYNRMAQDMSLQMCSTVLYVLEKRKDSITDEDLKVDSPYNTYLYSGLPKGPISNPGEACIKAALYPSTGNYLYFVVADEETGAHYFTSDYDSFVNAKVEYKQKY